MNISSDKEEIHENDKTKDRSTFFVVFLPIQYDISVVANKHDLKWEHELSSVSLGYENVQGALQNSLIIRKDTRSYLVAIWALMTSILISFFSIVIGLVNSRETNSSIRKWNLHDEHIEELAEEYSKIKDKIER